jgi:hypothetical protein
LSVVACSGAAQFVYDAWYATLTPDREFPREIRRILNTAFGELAERGRRVDLKRMLLWCAPLAGSLDQPPCCRRIAESGNMQCYGEMLTCPFPSKTVHGQSLALDGTVCVVGALHGWPVAALTAIDTLG